MLVFIVFGGILLLVGAYVALDWWLADRRTKRSLRSEVGPQKIEGPARKTGNIDALPPNASERFRHQQ